jgi:hypothetical protein
MLLKAPSECYQHVSKFILFLKKLRIILLRQELESIYNKSVHLSVCESVKSSSGWGLYHELDVHVAVSKNGAEFSTTKRDRVVTVEFI